MEKYLFTRNIIRVTQHGLGVDKDPFPIFRAEKRSAQASAHPLSQAQGGLFCVMLCSTVHLRKQSKIGYNTMGNVVIEGNS